MKKVMFYCQHIVGIRHLIRSMEIVRYLVKNFQVCFINGGEVIEEFEAPPSVEIVNIPAIRTDSEFRELQVVDNLSNLEEVQVIRREQLLSTLDRFQPDILIVELFPFGRRRFSFELIPLLEQAKANKTKIVSSLRDIVVTNQDKTRHEEKVCRLIDQYFDMLLIHGDPKFVELEEVFSRVNDLNCEVHYTGYVAQLSSEGSRNRLLPNPKKPTILVSVGGGRFGHDLLESIVKTAPILKQSIPHHLQVFTGPFIPGKVFAKLQVLAEGQTNITVEKYTSEFLSYMKNADLSISMSGYNTTINVLMTGVKAMIMPFKRNEDREQTIRAEKLEKMGRVKVICPQDLEAQKFASQIIDYLNQKTTDLQFDFNGAEKTANYLQQLLQQNEFASLNR